MLADIGLPDMDGYELARRLRRAGPDARLKLVAVSGYGQPGEPIKELLDPATAGTVWKENIAAADRYYKPGKFTTFVAYEWTSAPNSRNMHRNVIFKDSKKLPTLPFTAMDSPYPNDLWNWMDGQRKAGNEVLAISHNANLSDGIMFPVEEDYKGKPVALSRSAVASPDPLSKTWILNGACTWPCRGKSLIHKLPMWGGSAS